MDEPKKGTDRPKQVPNGGKGRPKGAINKTTKAAKDAIAQAAEALGGAERLTAWAQEDPANERVFWGTIYPKLLPLQVTGEGGGPIVTRVELAALDGDSTD
ncbi:hypothetical protein [Cupriavidus necator]|uniref:hypothetical protein n=1 Tax=Cupriavidus necator TaxID=106590 RepID=UPI00339D73C5